MVKFINVIDKEIIDSVLDNDKILILSEDSGIKQILKENVFVSQNDDINQIAHRLEQIQQTKQDKLLDITPEDNWKMLAVSYDGTWTVKAV